jgi:hypothetical protein
LFAATSRCGRRDPFGRFIGAQPLFTALGLLRACDSGRVYR